jgi:TnpA family transposase
MEVMVKTNQDNVDHCKAEPVYGGWGLSRYTSINRGYIGVVICRATCVDINIKP